MKIEKLVIVFMVIFSFLSCSKDEENIEDTKETNKKVDNEDNTKKSAFKIYETNNVASYKMTKDSYKKWKDNYEFGNNQQALKLITKNIYKEFKDDFDFIFLVLNENKPLWTTSP